MIRSLALNASRPDTRALRLRPRRGGDQTRVGDETGRGEPGTGRPGVGDAARSQLALEVGRSGLLLRSRPQVNDAGAKGAKFRHHRLDSETTLGSSSPVCLCGGRQSLLPGVR